jgi:alpha-galactosidase
VWCAWGYEREFSFPLVRATIPKMQELGLKWVVLDDGWQVRTGDWRPDPAKYPNGDADMRAFTDEIHSRGLLARIWIAPLQAAPGSDELHDFTDELLLDQDGAPQLVSWWNSFTLCPAYGKTQERMAALSRKIIGEWGFDGFKVDGQHLNGVAPCSNPAHHHAHPEDSTQHLGDFYKALYDGVKAVNPAAVVEVCPCGTGYAYHNMPWIDSAPASDPTSSWQVRHKGKTLKALMGASAAYAGDHVELSTGGQDFASAVGVGGVVSTKFTWPVDPKPKDSFLLTPEHEAHWKKWIGAYNARRLAQGTYRGELYDIAFDKPETHVVEKAGVLHYAFFADTWKGPVTLRGLGAGDWVIEDWIEGRTLGTVSSQRPTLDVSFNHNLLILARQA